MPKVFLRCFMGIKPALIRDANESSQSSSTFAQLSRPQGRVVVAVNAAKPITMHALEWAVVNIPNPSNRVTLFVVVPASCGLCGLKGTWCQPCGRNEADLAQLCIQMKDQIKGLSMKKQIQVGVQILDNAVSLVTMVERLGASWLVLDEELKKEEKPCLAQLTCNMVTVKGSDNVKFLRMNLKCESNAPEGECDSHTNYNDDVENLNLQTSSSSDLLPGLSYASSPCPIGVDDDNDSLEFTCKAADEQCTGSSGAVSSRIVCCADGLTSGQQPVSLDLPRTMAVGSCVGSFVSQFNALDEQYPSIAAISGHSSQIASIKMLKANQNRSKSLDFHLERTIMLETHMSSGVWSSADSSFSSLCDRDEESYSWSYQCRHGGSSIINLSPKLGSYTMVPGLSPSDSISRIEAHNKQHSMLRQLFLSKNCVGGFKCSTQCHNDPHMYGRHAEPSMMKVPDEVNDGCILGAANIARPLCSICQNRPPMMGQPVTRFKYEELEEATMGFSQDSFLAEGGFGSVHKGRLGDGQLIAVKQLKEASAQGDKEFHSEIEVLSCVRHRNLVMLIGYCMEQGRRLLVYEFICNGTLSFHLFGAGSESGTGLVWSARQKIALGAARGLRFLHEDCRVGCIIHRDLRPTNILLTHDFEPLVGDFGLARYQHDGQQEEETRVLGTFGYLAPEYVRTGLLTEKADVYSFGVILLELITGRKAVDLNSPRGQQCLIEWARPLLIRHAIYELMDPRLRGQFDEGEAQRMMHAASMCISRDPQHRPRMSKVLKMLEAM